MQMLIRRQHPPLGVGIPLRQAPLVPLDPLTRHNAQLGAAKRMTKVRDRVPRPVIHLPLHTHPLTTLTTTTCRSRRLRKHDPVHGTPQQAIRPVRQQIADIHQDRRRWVVFRARRDDRHGRPGGAVAREHLEPRLAAQAEEQRQRAVIGVRAGADVAAGWGAGC